MRLFGAPRPKPPFEARLATERMASALGSEILGIVGKLGGEIRFSSEPPGMCFQALLPIIPPYGRAL
jgi:hypothetical protein